MFDHLKTDKKPIPAKQSVPTLSSPPPTVLPSNSYISSLQPQQLSAKQEILANIAALQTEVIKVQQRITTLTSKARKIEQSQSSNSPKQSVTIETLLQKVEQNFTELEARLHTIEEPFNPMEWRSQIKTNSFLRRRLLWVGLTIPLLILLGFQGQQMHLLHKAYLKLNTIEIRIRRIEAQQN